MDKSSTIQILTCIAGAYQIGKITATERKKYTKIVMESINNDDDLEVYSMLGEIEEKAPECLISLEKEKNNE